MADKTEYERQHTQFSDNTRVLLDLQSQLRNVADAKERQVEASEVIGQKINERRAALHQLVDITADELLAECQKERKKNFVILDEEMENIIKQRSNTSGTEQNRSRFPNPIQYLENPLNDDLIKDGFGSVVNNLQKFSYESEFAVDASLPAETKQNALTHRSMEFERVVGVKKSFSVFREFRHSSTSEVSVITPYEDDLYLVKCYKKTQIKLINEKGKVKKTVKLQSQEVRGFDKNSRSIIFVCSEGPNCINKLVLPQGQISVLFSTGVLRPLDVRCTKAGELLVVLVDDKLDERTPESKRLLVKYSPEGDEILRVERDVFDDRIFILPTKVRTNHSEDTVAVIDDDLDLRISYLILLDWKLNVKLRYLGHGRIIHGNERFHVSKAKAFRITDIKFDHRDNILICEKNYCTVQLLSPTCEILLQVFKSYISIPTSLALADDGKLLIGQDDGRIKVLR